MVFLHLNGSLITSEGLEFFLQLDLEKFVVQFKEQKINGFYLTEKENGKMNNLQKFKELKND